MRHPGSSGEGIGAPPGAGAPLVSSRIWLVIFTDLAALLLAFFVLLFAMSRPQPELWRATVTSLAKSLDPAAVHEHAPRAPHSLDGRMPEAASNLDYLAGVLDATLAADAVLARADVERRHDAIGLAFPASTLLEPGNAGLAADARAPLTALGGLLRNIANGVGVVVHLQPGSPAAVPSAGGWQRAIVAAAVVANALRDGGYDRPVVALGGLAAAAAPTDGSRIHITLFSAEDAP